MVTWHNAREMASKSTPAEIHKFKAALLKVDATLREFDELHDRLDRQYCTQTFPAFAALVRVFCSTGGALGEDEDRACKLVNVFETKVHVFARRHSLKAYDAFGSVRASIFDSAKMSPTDTVAKGSSRYIWATVLSHLILVAESGASADQLCETMFICNELVVPLSSPQSALLTQFFHFLLCMHTVYGVLPTSLALLALSADGVSESADGK